MEYRKIFEAIIPEKCLDFTKLNGGTTNLSFSVVTNRGHYILRVPGEGTNKYINRINEKLNIEQVYKLGIVPEIIYFDPYTGVMVSKYIENSTPMTITDINDECNVKLIAASLVRVHNSLMRFTNEFDILLVQNEYKKLLKNMGSSIPFELESRTADLEKYLNILFVKYPKQLVTCHGDPKLNNFLLAVGKMWMIDWEYSGMADKYFDIVNLIMTDKLNDREEAMFIKAYEECDNQDICREKLLLWKIATDYLWIYWHLIKLNQGQMIEYNRYSWQNRLNRAISNMRILEEF